MGKRKITILLSTVIVLTGLLFGYIVLQVRNQPIAGTSFVMNTVVEYKLYGKNAKQAMHEIEQTLIDIENKMSMYIDSSEISRLNQAAGSNPVALSEDTFALLARCMGFGNRSGGVFDITIAPVTQEWDVTSAQPKIPEAQKIEELLALVDYNDMLLDGGSYSAMLKEKGQSIDVGGVAKGFACDAARRVAQKNGVTSGFISIGGNMMVVGAKPDGAPFKFGIRDPRGGVNDYLAVVSLPNSTMATSGDYERYFEQDGKRYHHILDPQTGYPAQTDLMSVSVITPDGAYADFMSTYLFIMGKDFALENLNAFDCGLIVVDRDKNVYVSESVKDSFTPADQTGTYHFVTGQ